ncbi:hypothetical protein SCLCIDRAFT_34013 [Scleroderma citrinum Foug A]|uniref:Uncharacterized protein n=1 Tax=Scleroderma citrinum Foug A TaxID=1036808 RepID=A0A0C3CQA0_9AGAM|nr:hypothetical protein SCLCIDRAFT_34013 [Scleroderma citrinum Foug A]
MATSENDKLKLRIRQLELELGQGSSSGGASAAGSPRDVLNPISKRQNLLQTLKSAKLDL